MEKAYNCSRSFIKGQLDLDPALKKQLESLETEDESGNMTEAEATYSDAARRLHHVISYLTNAYIILTIS